MITKSQAERIVQATSYRDWRIEPVAYEQLAIWQILQQISADLNRVLAVNFTYTAPDSRPDVEGDVTNMINLGIPLTETEAEFARALYEAISIIEEHERREFFTVGLDVIKSRPHERASTYDPKGWDTTNASGQKEALFHPHGINRNRMFHDLDPFAKELKIKTLVDNVMTSDAV